MAKKQTYQMKFMLTHGFMNREVEYALDRVERMDREQLPLVLAQPGKGDRVMAEKAAAAWRLEAGV